MCDRFLSMYSRSSLSTSSISMATKSMCAGIISTFGAFVGIIHASAEAVCSRSWYDPVSTLSTSIPNPEEALA